MSTDVPALLQSILDTGEAIRAALAAGDFDEAARLAVERNGLVAQLGPPPAAPQAERLAPLAVQLAAQHRDLAVDAEAALARLMEERRQVGRIQRAAGHYGAAAPPPSQLDAAG